MPKPSLNLILIIVALSCLLLGTSMMLMGEHKHIQLVTEFYGIEDYTSTQNSSYLAAFSFIVSALLALMALINPQFISYAGLASLVISAVPLVALLSPTMWIESLGGFPAIGSGQGVIKYFALMALAISLIKANALSPRFISWLNLAPVLLVLLWIGGMKFTAIEASGIEDLIKSSPLMSWMYGVWDLQTTSNLIGVYDLLAVALLIASVFKSALLIPAIAMAGAVFAVTQTFLFTWPGALSADTLLTTGGHFLIKDLWYIANLILFYHYVHQHQATR